MMGRKGFTLAEVLIALALLGVIAAFTFPKVMQSAANAQKRAVFKETIATLYDFYTTGRLNDDFRALDANIQACNNANSSLAVHDLMRARLNTISSCAAGAANCPNVWPAGVDNGSGILTLGNGATIMDLDNLNMTDEGGDGVCTAYDIILVDWNGANGPNVEGDDYLNLWVSVRGSDTKLLGGGRPPLRPGQMNTMCGLDCMALFDAAVVN